MDEKENGEKPSKKSVKLKTILILLVITFFLFFCSGGMTALVLAIQYQRSPETSLNETIGAPEEKFEINIPNADLIIEGTTTNEIKVDLKGKEKIINNLSLNEGEKSATLDYKSLSFVYLNSFDLLNPEKNKIKGTITLPENLDLELNLSGGNSVKLNKITSKVKINISGSGDITFEDSVVSDGDITISGSGNINMDQCIAKLNLTISGAGSFKANSCTLNNLDINSSGYGNVEISDGNIINAKIRLSGSGNIKIPEVRGKLDQEISGAGKVEFTN